jgi:hypothetical protein
MLGNVITDSIGLGSLILAVPIAILAIVQIRASRAARRQVVIEEAKVKAEAERQAILEYVRAQLVPSNGKTVAQTLEQLLMVLNDRTVLFEEMRAKLDDLSNLLAVHVADGHGGAGHKIST